MQYRCSALLAARAPKARSSYYGLRVLRKVMIQHIRELWAVVIDRRHAAENVAKRAALKDEWLKLSRIQSKPIYTTRSQLGLWRKLRRLQVATGG